mgnify:CR=1 FL=1
MRRRQLIEIEDQAWCPPSLRDALTDYLRFALDLTTPYHVIVPRLVRAIRQSRATRVIDLCSGAGGPWRTLLPALRSHGCSAPVTLTDLCASRPARDASSSVSHAGRPSRHNRLIRASPLVAGHPRRRSPQSVESAR